MDAIDRRIDAVIGETSKRLDGGTIPPALTGDVDTDYDVAGQTITDPTTTNPPAEKLEWRTADEARDVTSRLTEYADAALGDPDTVRVITLNDAFRLVQISGREYLNVAEDYALAAIRLLIERHLWGPRLFNDTTGSITGFGEDGRFESTLSLINNFRATQRLPYGGEVEARWIWRQTEALREQATGRYRQSSEIIFGANLPLLRGAGTVAREDLIQAERSIVYASRTFEDRRRELLVRIAEDYFDLLQTATRIQNQTAQLESLRTLERSTQARVDAGRLSEFQVGIVANQVLSGEQTLANLRELYVLQLDRFKVRLGLNVSDPIAIAPLEFAVPEPEITTEAAVAAALEYRLDLQNERDRLVDARRAINNARNALLPDLDIAGEVGVPTDDDDQEGGVLFDFDDTTYRASVSLGLPLDREIERLQLRDRIIRFERARRDFEQFRDQVTLDSRAAVRSVDLARFSLNLAEQQVEINRRRLQEQQLKEDEVSQQEIVDSENALLDAQNSRDAALTGLRNAVLNYLETTGQLRVAPDGTFQALPGMADTARQP